MKRKRHLRAKALAVGAALGVASSADAAVFNVTTNADNGAGSLRQAIIDANAAGGPDTITFNAGLSGSTITLTTGEMAILDSVDIQGLGSANLTVDANNDSRVFYIYNPNPVPVDVTISGLTLANGFSVVPGDAVESAGGAVSVIGENLALDDVDILNSVAGGAGGGISFLGVDTPSSYNEVSAVLSVQNSTISGNTAEHVDLGVPVDQGGCGGGIYAASIYNVILDNVTLSNNVARCSGGGFAGIYFQDGGTVTIQSSVITGNSINASEGGSGGGIAFIYGYSYGEIASVIDTTVSGNDGGEYGGGIASVYLYGLAIRRTTISGNQAESGAGVAPVFTVGTIENSTVAENTASLHGGGIYSVYSYLTVKETTISGNTATTDGPGIYAYLYSEVDLVNSIVANNGPGADLVDDTDSFFDVSYSLIENPDVAEINDNGGNIFEDDPELGPLQDNGGPTFTMKPAGTSPVVDT
ncbi:MAG: choice-of-anchor Q domain-containing protein, partial [Thermoanaerobaculia bacterium]